MIGGCRSGHVKLRTAEFWLKVSSQMGYEKLEIYENIKLKLLAFGGLTM